MARRIDSDATYVLARALAKSLHLAGRSEEALAILRPLAVIASSAQAGIQETLQAIQRECNAKCRF